MDSRALKILVIQTGGLGNWLMATGAFRDIRLHYPNARITHLTQPALSGLARQEDFFDDLLLTKWDQPNDWDKFLESLFFNQLWKHKIKELGFDIIFDFHCRKIEKTFYRDLSTKAFFLKKEYPHIFNVYQDLLKEAGVLCQSEPRLHYFPVFNEKLGNSEDPISKPFVALIARSKKEKSGKNWPVEKAQALASLLQERGLTPVIIGRQQDLLPLKPLREMKGNIDLVNRAPLEMLSGLFAKAALAIGVDTGTTHLAAITGTPTVALYGPSPHEIWGIRGRQTSWVKKNGMNQISVNDVWKACEAHLLTSLL